jgi:integrase/recombinase XerD
MKVEAATRIYVARMRSLGFRYDGIDEFLRSFAAALGDRDLSELIPSDISVFLSSRKICSRTWQQNYDKLRLFFRYMNLVDQLRGYPLPPRKRAFPKTFVPYIYSIGEIRMLTSNRILEKALNDPNRLNVLDPDTVRAFILFLYGTGVSVNEALNLLWKNVDFKRNIVSVGRYMDSPLRTIPISRDVHKLLMEHRDCKKRQRLWSDYCFATKFGKKVAHSTMVTNFRHIRDLCGILRTGGSYYQARMHDLRHTFAVNRIRAWCREGVDIRSMIPALTAYLGQAGFSAERYLFLTPEHYRKQV